MTENIDTTSTSQSTIHQITTFEDAMPIEQQFFPDQMPVDSKQLVHISEKRDHSTSDFLKREYVVLNVSLPAGGSQGDVIHTFEFPKDLMLASTQTSKKADRFAFIRGTVVLRAVVAAHPDTQGALTLTYIPDIGVAEVNERSQIAMQQTQHSHVILNLNNAEGCELSVPFLSPYDAISLSNPQSRNGYVKVCLLTPLAGNTDITFFARYADDLMLEHPTPMPISSTFSLAAQNFNNLVKRIEEADNVKDVLRMVKDGQNLMDFHSQTESQKQNNEGIISGITSKLSTISRVASGLPFVGSLAAMATPVLDIGTNLAKTFGFSKPNQDKPTVPAIVSPFNDHLSAEGIRIPNTFNYHYNNTVQTLPGEFGTDIDEMAIETIARRKQLIPFINGAGDTVTIGSVGTSTPQRTVLAVIPLSPAFWWLPFGPDKIDRTEMIPTHFAWLFSFFRFWSCDMVFDVNFYLTAFHKAQVRFAFVPGSFSSTNFATLDYNTANSSVIPIHSENSSHTQRINCLRHVQKLRVPDFDNQILSPRNNIGHFVVLLETKLVATEAVSPTVNFTIFAHLENVELSVPAVNNVLFPTKFGVTQIPYKDLEDEKHMFSVRTHDRSETQAGTIETGAIGATTSTSSEQPLISAQVATGECTTSLKQIGNCYTKSASFPVADSETLHTLYNPSGYTEATALYFNAVHHDLIDSIAAGFAFRKGGYNVRIVPHNADLNRRWRVWLSDHEFPVTFGDKFVNFIVDGDHTLTVASVSKREIPISTVLQRGVEVHVPYNQPTSKVLVKPPTNAVDFMKPVANWVTLSDADFHTGTSEYTYCDFFRSFAEDTKYGCMIALPIMTRYKANFVPPP